MDIKTCSDATTLAVLIAALVLNVVLYGIFRNCLVGGI